MKLYLSRMRDGRYTLTLLPMVLTPLKAVPGVADFYMQPGDPVGMLRAICSLGIEMINKECALKPLTYRRVEVQMIPLSEPTTPDEVETKS